MHKNCFQKIILFTLTGFLFSQCSQAETPVGNKGRFFFYWGWNRAWYTKSDITFSGTDYVFTLDKVIAKDRQSPFNAGLYLNPLKATIPQVNYRIGYYFKDKYSISIGTDHMKYVMVQEQDVKISGTIKNSGTEYDGNYDNNDIIVREKFLKFEHTDGLNYINCSLRRTDRIFNLQNAGLKNGSVNLVTGAGSGILLPRTNTTLLNNKRYDQYHLAGYGFDLLTGINISFCRFFFIQSELKGGFINMPDIRTTEYKTDKAKQHFYFIQSNIILGASFLLVNEKKDKTGNPQ